MVIVYGQAEWRDDGMFTCCTIAYGRRVFHYQRNVWSVAAACCAVVEASFRPTMMLTLFVIKLFWTAFGLFMLFLDGGTPSI